MKTKDTINKIYEYDATSAEWLRKLKIADIVVVSPTLASTAVATGDNTLASTTTDSTHIMYLTGFSISSTLAAGVGCITVGNSTYMQNLLSPGGNGPLANNSDRLNINTMRDGPMVKVPISTSVKLMFNATTAGTATGYAVFIKEPIRSKIETE